MRANSEPADGSTAEKKGVLRDMVVEQIRQLILHKQLPGGARLPSERDLAARFSISRHLIREALRILEQQHQIYTQLGSGSYVMELGMPSGNTHSKDAALRKERANLMEIFEFRRRVEPRIAFLAATHATPQDHALLLRILEESKRVIDALDVSEWNRLDALFHSRLAAMTDNSLYTKTATLLTQAMVTFRDGGAKPLEARMRPAFTAHDAITRAIINGRAKEAADAMEQHITLAVRNAFKYLSED